MDAYVTEHANGFASRAEIKEAILKALDDMAPPDERAKTWGVKMSSKEWQTLKARTDKR